MENFDAFQIVRLIGALAFVLALMGGFSILIRRLGLNDGQSPFAQKKRLQVQETLSLDHKRKAVILRCDDEEHLVILGSTQDNFIKTLNTNNTKPVPKKGRQPRERTQTAIKPRSINTPQANVLKAKKAPVI